MPRWINLFMRRHSSYGYISYSLGYSKDGRPFYTKKEAEKEGKEREKSPWALGEKFVKSVKIPNEGQEI